MSATGRDARSVQNAFDIGSSDGVADVLTFYRTAMIDRAIVVAACHSAEPQKLSCSI